MESLTSAISFNLTAHDLFLIAFLAFLEGVLSVDNALVLAMMAKPLPRELQRKALTYGLAGAIIFRLASLAIVSHLMRWNWVKYVGGGYLIFIALKHFRSAEQEKHPSKVAATNFWKIVLMIELMDIAFAVDSILAAVAITNKFWIVFAGGIMGVILMRFAAMAFIKLLKKFPHMETTAFLLVLFIGIKLVIEGLKIPGTDFHSTSNPAFVIFWSIMALTILSGFRPKQKHN